MIAISTRGSQGMCHTLLLVALDVYKGTICLNRGDLSLAVEYDEERKAHSANPTMQISAFPHKIHTPFQGTRAQHLEAGLMHHHSAVNSLNGHRLPLSEPSAVPGELERYLKPH